MNKNIQECKCEDRNTNYHLTVCCKGMKSLEEIIANTIATEYKGCIDIGSDITPLADVVRAYLLEELGEALEKIVNIIGGPNASSSEFTRLVDSLKIAEDTLRELKAKRK